MKSNNKYLFDNQLLILNQFLPQQDHLEDSHIKLLYIDPKRPNDMQFQLDDLVTLDSLSLLDKLREVGFKDTYCDYPYKYHAKLLEMFLGKALPAPR